MLARCLFPSPLPLHPPQMYRDGCQGSTQACARGAVTVRQPGHRRTNTARVRLQHCCALFAAPLEGKDVFRHGCLWQRTVYNVLEEKDPVWQAL